MCDLPCWPPGSLGTVPSVSAPPSTLHHHHPADQQRFPAEVTAALPPLPPHTPAGPERSDKNWEERVNQLNPSDKSQGPSYSSCRDSEKLSTQKIFNLVSCCFFLLSYALYADALALQLHPDASVCFLLI